MTNFLSASPSPWGIAINSETQECAAYWGGDEYVRYDLYEGWIEYYPRYYEDSEGIIETPFGNCTFQRNNEVQCCNELGLTYISELPLDKKRTNNILRFSNMHPVLSSVIYYVLLIGIPLAILAGLFFLIRHFVRKKRANQKGFKR